MATADLPTHQLQAVAFHLMSRCAEQTEAFNDCVKNSPKPSSACVEEYKALSACSKAL